MSLSETIRHDAQGAQKDASEEGRRRLGVLRMLVAAVQNEEIALKVKDKGLTDEQAIAVVRREVKKRKDAVTLYRTHGEEGRAAAEEGELAVLGAYLPAAFAQEQLRAVIAATIEAIPPSERNLGHIMKEVMVKCKGSADGAQVRTLVQEMLSAK